MAILGEQWVAGTKFAYDCDSGKAVITEAMYDELITVEEDKFTIDEPGNVLLLQYLKKGCYKCLPQSTHK